MNNAREEFNARSGLRSAEVQRALTAEEQADAALADAQAQVDAAAVETRKRTEQAMLSTYGSEDALRRVFSERAAIVDNNIKTAAYNVASLRNALATQLQAEAQAFDDCAHSADLREGIEAFFAKRPATFQGR